MKPLTELLTDFHKLVTKLTVAVAFLIGAILPAASFDASYASNAPEEASSLYAQAVESFRAGKLEDARSAMLQLETEHAEDPTLLLNLGLIAEKEGRPGAAIALWRKGLASHPTDSDLLNAIDWIKSKLDRGAFPRDVGTWETLRQSLLLRVSPFATVGGSAILLILAGIFFLRWFGRRKRALENELALPPPPLAAIVFSVLFCFLLSVSIAIFVDRLDLRGTVIQAKIGARSAPDIAATVLFDIAEGAEVTVRDTRIVADLEWRRITTTDGKTGWMPANTVLTTDDSPRRAFETGAPK
ncbi:MAG: hypothetical protein RBT63_00210 [Bdellovibrionales bacterium]|jgi:hypothetical protein|nr:hypothetical protein [Bdellovibrionales bacterium]